MWNHLKFFSKKEKFSNINGMWAYAFYDKKKHKLSLGRDILGERHIFYYLENDNLFFSSEVEPILHVSEKKHKFNYKNMIEAWRYNSCSRGRTLIKNIFKLEPGFSLEIYKSKIQKKNNKKST